MKLTQIIEELKLTVNCAADKIDTDVQSGYASDLLSDVLANARENALWITLQVHQNIVAVASMKDLAGIVLVNSREPEPDTVIAAEREGVPIMTSDLPSFELIGKLYALGVHGTTDDS
jgi:hypothetical protein